ncbi:uncharacterized protein DDB_G0283357-like [Eupeodes corollae]|uniref:uncharacterized protein DDB_G0283357-like n=1 Tax=Eupeodes corollae TaxID=290404 RepID=UPI00249155FF|nr:uncharacterized protein DDB_G0283357-like [Eupeodes corollae]
MPVGHYTSRPYSSFRAGKLNSSSIIHTASSSISTKPQYNYLSPTASSSSSSVAAAQSVSSSSFTNQRLQPFRSSLYGTKSTAGAAASSDYRRVTGSSSAAVTAIKPLTPKTCRRIESYADAVNGGNKTKNLTPLKTNNNNGNSNNNNNTNSTTKQFLRSRSNNNNIARSQNFDRGNQSNISFRSRNNLQPHQHQHQQQHAKSPAVSSSGASDESIVPKYGGAMYNSNGGRTTTALLNCGSQKRAYNTVKVPKENVPMNSNSSRSNGSSGYFNRFSTSTTLASKVAPPVTKDITKPAGAGNKIPLAPLQHKKKYKEDNKLSSSSSPQLNGVHNRRQYPTTVIVGGGGNRGRGDGAGSTGSTLNDSSASGSLSGGSQGSPRTKKAFSTKFPNGLPFEDEFYRWRSFSQSSSNYSPYSGAPRSNVRDDVNMARTKFNGDNDVDDDQDIDNENDLDRDDDEFTRKPSNEPLYVDFSKPITQQQQQRRKNDSDTSSISSSYYQRQQRHHQHYFESARGQAPQAASSHLHYTHQRQQAQPQTQPQQAQQQYRTSGYLYNGKNESSSFRTTTRRVVRGTGCSIHDNINNNDCAATATTTKTYSSYSDRNNNNIKFLQQQSRRDILEPTNCEYNYDRSSRRRKERSKRSHRKSPTSGRRAHKYRYRDEASHSSSRRRHRDRPKERDNRTSPSKKLRESVPSNRNRISLFIE